MMMIDTCDCVRQTKKIHKNENEKTQKYESQNAPTM